ncbi:MAG TPA: RnfABCDGE type electron transport complex subunit G [Bacillota bacterium]|nr:RnfABCDGE type electron transport complex subunit G [Bacillota bacterium]HOL08543.1 RnfABCDGE type electron transport complex subunit G [Bacillota bacterium]HPO96976.1 RnfABCDGE type electron transport complex subunit G [Bacillota bacterium]
MDKFYLRLMLVLALICGIAGCTLALVNSYTEPIIAKYKAQAEIKAYQKALPEAERFIDDPELIKVVKDNPNYKGIQSLKVGLKNGQRIGLVFKVATSGYSSDIQMLVGINSDGQLYQVLILDQQETPGLGSRITDTEFIGQKAIYNSGTKKLALTKDGGSVQAVTGATISSRAVVRGINQALAAYQSFNNATNDAAGASDHNDVDATTGATTK